MSASISSINYCPVKSLSIQSIDECEIKKNIGIVGDRSFAFSRIIDLKKALIVEKNPSERKLNNFLTLKNSPVLNKYNFEYKNNKLIFKLGDKELLSIIADDPEQKSKLVNKILKLEDSLIKPIFLMQNDVTPFFDTSHSNKTFNSISLINLNSIKDFEKKIYQKIELERFRGNFYIEGLEAWEERKWIGKIIKINNISFKVEKNIPRCTAINLKPKTDISDKSLLKLLKKSYDHFDMGIYLRSLDEGKIEAGNILEC